MPALFSLCYLRIFVLVCPHRGCPVRSHSRKWLLLGSAETTSQGDCSHFGQLAVHGGINLFRRALSADVGGQHVRDLVSFATYLDLVIRNQKVSLMMTGLDTGALGILGYVLVLVQIGGFAYGGFYLFSKLRLRAYCERCEALLGQSMVDSRYAVADEEMSQLFDALKKFYKGGQISEAISFFVQWGLPIPPGHCRLATDIVLCPCTKCGGQWVQFQGRKLIKGDYRNVGSWYVAGFASTPVIAMRTRQN